VIAVAAVVVADIAAAGIGAVDFAAERDNNGNADYTGFSDFRGFPLVELIATRITRIKRIFADFKKSAAIRKIRVIRVAIVVALKKTPASCKGSRRHSYNRMD
jgi:hypothetical protein